MVEFWEFPEEDVEGVMRETGLFPYYSLLAAVRAGVATSHERRKAIAFAGMLRRDFDRDLSGLTEDEFIDQIGLGIVMTIMDARLLASA